MLAGLNEDLAFPLLLPRPKIPKDGPLYDSITGRRVLVTGAGGSIGSELVLQIAAAQPACVVMLDQSELNLYEIDSTVRQGAPHIPRVAAVCDVRDERAISDLFWETKPDIVFHAAAMKHVPLLETPHNLVEAVLTNVVGTMNIVDACVTNAAEMILISTDKAVNPTSVMGHTKRLAELYTESRCTRSVGRKFAQVRFGNVIGSSGSVVPLFRRQIAQGGPVTITHPHMTRYMLSIKEAVALVLSASVMNHENGANYGLYILDMGEPVKILDIAHQLISLAGLTPGRDIPIEVIGMRPGEKLHEELSYPWEDLTRCANPRVFKAHPAIPLSPAFHSEIRGLSVLRTSRNADWAIDRMEKIISMDHNFHLKSEA